MTSALVRAGRFVLLAGMTLGLQSQAAAEDPAEIGNWFGDPFFQVRNRMPDCPEPLGPRLSRKEATRQEHSRVERGTSCYLAGTCSKPNAYLYDQSISGAVQKIFADDHELASDSSLWITVTRRFVYLEGCEPDSKQIERAEKAIRSIPDVQLVITNVTADAHGHLPYKPWSGATK